MPKKRLFIAINLPADIKDKISEIIQEIRPLFNELEGKIRFLKPEAWHLTITFLGYQEEEVTPSILKSIDSTIKSHFHPLENIRIIFDKLIYAPPGRQPRMIWLGGDKKSSEALANIKKPLEDELVKNGVKFQRETRPYNAHLTLARFPSMEVQPPYIAPLPEVEPPIVLNVESLDLMESHLKRTGAEYEILSALTFKKN